MPSGSQARQVAGAGVGSKRSHQQIDSSSNPLAGIEVKKEILPPQQRPRRGGAQGQENEIGSAIAGGVDEEMVDSEGVGGVEGELNEETQTKADENEQQLLQQEYSKTAFIIPSCSGWFNIDSIHEIEMQSLPEFFCGKFPHKNPATYLDYRNYIIKLYRESPNAYLSATVCRKNLAGDVCSIIRLHAFLEHWGLINFNV